MDLSNMFPRQATTHDLKILEKILGQKARASLKNQGSMNKRINELEEQLAKMTLLCRTLSDVVVRKGIVALAELVEIMDEIDRDDGVADGQVTPKRKRPKGNCVSFPKFPAVPCRFGSPLSRSHAVVRGSFQHACLR